LVYGVAFLSLVAQIDGLIGSHGILPAREFLAAVAERFGAERFVLLPSLCWLGCSDAMLHVLCWGGAVCAALLFFDVLPLAMLAVCWVAYVSLASVGQDFLSFQWDALLLETGFLAFLVAPEHVWRRAWRPSGDAPRIGLVCLWILLFK